MSWYKVMVTDDQFAQGVSRKLMEDFIQCYSQHGSPSDAALFAETSEGYYAMYFSPAAVSICRDLIVGHAGASCDKPAASQVTLLAGRGTQAWDLLK